MSIRNSYFILLHLLFITFASYLGVNAFYKLSFSRFSQVLPFSSFEGREEKDRLSPITQQRPLSHYRTISERDLFKTVKEIPPKTKTETKPAVSDLKETALRIKLFGTVTGEESYAVIRDEKKRKQQLYAAGDSIQNARIRKILRNKVILDVNGKSEVLKLEKRNSRGRRYSSAPKTLLPSNIRKRNIRISRSSVDNAMNNINDLMKQAKIRPHFRNGRPDGLTLSRIKRNSIFRKLGLRSGDIIMGVNGDEIRSVDDALSFYNSLKSSSGVSLRIKRRGRYQDMNYNIQ